MGVWSSSFYSSFFWIFDVNKRFRFFFSFRRICFPIYLDEAKANMLGHFDHCGNQHKWNACEIFQKPRNNYNIFVYFSVFKLLFCIFFSFLTTFPLFNDSTSNSHVLFRVCWKIHLLVTLTLIDIIKIGINCHFICNRIIFTCVRCYLDFNDKIMIHHGVVINNYRCFFFFCIIKSTF